MTFDEIVSEMRRNPDAHLLIEWIANRVKEEPGEVSSGEIEYVSNEYFKSIEDI